MAFVQDISIISIFFFAKREISFKVPTFRGSLFSGGSLLSGFDNNCDILSLLSEICFFQGGVTFRTLLYRKSYMMYMLSKFPFIIVMTKIISVCD